MTEAVFEGDSKNYKQTKWGNYFDSRRLTLTTETVQYEDWV